MTGNPGCSQSCDKMYSDCVESCRGCCDGNEVKKVDKLKNLSAALKRFKMVDTDDTTSIGRITVEELVKFFEGHPCIDAKKEHRNSIRMEMESH